MAAILIKIYSKQLFELFFYQILWGKRCYKYACERLRGCVIGAWDLTQR